MPELEVLFNPLLLFKSEKTVLTVFLKSPAWSKAFLSRLWQQCCQSCRALISPDYQLSWPSSKWQAWTILFHLYFYTQKLEGNHPFSLKWCLCRVITVCLVMLDCTTRMTTVSKRRYKAREWAVITLEELGVRRSVHWHDLSLVLLK